MTEPVGKTESRPEQKSVGIPTWVPSILCVLFLGAASAYFFRGVFDPANTIEGLDTQFWQPMIVHKWTKGLFIPRWFPHFFAGFAQQYHFLSHQLPLLLMLSPNRFLGFQFMLDSFLAGAFMFAFLRSRKIGWFGSVVGATAYQLGNNLLTNASLGVLWKFGTVCWAPLFLLFFIRVIEGAPNRLRNSVFAGATLGMQFLGGEVQLAYYTGLLAAAYFLFDSANRLWNSRGARPFCEPLKDEGKRFLWAFLCAALAAVFAAEVFCSYASFAKVNENVEPDNWRFVTEFSFPPRETVALALTSHVFETDDYPLEYQGKPIPRISDDYFGIIVLLFVAMALVSRKKKVYFFAAAALVTLIVSYGGFFPLLFRLVYVLPAMKGLRNMHKWTFIMTLCVSVLAGMGADFWRNAPPEKNRKILCAVVIFFALVMVLAFLSPFAAGNSSYMISPGVWARIVLLAVASTICLLGRTKKVSNMAAFSRVVPLILIFLMAGDLIQNASRFLKYYDHKSRYEEDDIVKWLRSRPKPFRVKLWSENPYLRCLFMEVLPYRGIDSADAIVSRRPRRYSNLFQALKDERLSFERYFQLFNVKYILAPHPVQTANIPVNLATSFHSTSDLESAKECYVYELTTYLPRAFIVDRFEATESEKALDVIGRADFDLRTTVALEKHPGLMLDEKPDGPSWGVKNFVQSPHRVSMNVTVDRPSILVLHDFMDEYWHAYVDTEEVELLRANYLMRAVVVPDGAHTVIFTYKPPVWGYTITLAAWAVIISIVMFIAARKVISFHNANHGPT